MTPYRSPEDFAREHGHIVEALEQPGISTTADSNRNFSPVMDDPARAPLAYRLYRDFGEAARKEWQVADILGVGEFSTFFGEPGSGKSVLVGDLLLHAAANRDWHQRKIRGGLSVYLALERASVVIRRALAFRVRTDLVNLPFALVSGPINFLDAAVAQQIVDTVHRMEDETGVGLVLLGVDTVSAALCGGDENSPRDMGAFVATIRRIQAGVPSAHVVAVHHQPHDAPRLRGHGALLGAVDTTVEVSGKEGGTRTAIVRKQNDGMEGEQVVFMLESTVIHEDEAGTTTAPIVVAVDVEPVERSNPRKKLTNAAKIALAALRDAIIVAGEIPPVSNYIPDATRAVTDRVWRQYAYRRGISGSDQERAKQLAFQRAKEALLAANEVGAWDDLVWLAR